MKKSFFNFFFWNFRETTRHFSLRSQNSEYLRILQVTGANQNARKLLSTDLVNTKYISEKWTSQYDNFLCDSEFHAYTIIRQTFEKWEHEVQASVSTAFSSSPKPSRVFL